MKKGLILLADGFEESEAITTYDILCRTKAIEVDLVAIGVNELVTSSHGVKMLAKYTLNAITTSSYDFIVLPGGKTGVENLASSDLVKKTIEMFYKEDKPIYAICAAPSILGDMGILDGRMYTCYPGFERGSGIKINGQVMYTEDDPTLITAESMGVSIDFALAIVRNLLGEEAWEAINDQIYPTPLPN